MTIINGTSGNDVLTGTSGVDTLNAGAGNDTINFGAYLTSADEIDGGTGTDTLNLNGDYGVEVVLSPSTITNVETINLAAGNNYRLTTSYATTTSGGTLTVNASLLGVHDILIFNGQAETVANFHITGGAGDDSIIGGQNANTIDGGDGNDTIYSGNGHNVLNGGVGNDELYGGSGNDTLNGGSGNDLLMGGGGTDALAGGDGNDFIITGGWSSSDVAVASTIDGGAGNDDLYLNRCSLTSAVSLTFTPGANTATSLPDHTSFKNIEILELITGSGNDSVTFNEPVLAQGLGSSDSWDGGAGIDTLTVDLSASSAALSMNASGGSTTGSIAANNYALLNFVRVEHLHVVGGSGSDSLEGGTGNDVLVGNAGNDTLRGNGGQNTLSGGSGNDSLHDSGVASSIDGGTGIDNLFLDRAGSHGNVSLTFKPGSAATLYDGTAFKNIEFLTISTGSGNDTVTFDHPIADTRPFSDPFWSNDHWNAGSGNDTVVVNLAGTTKPLITCSYEAGEYNTYQYGEALIVSCNDVENFVMTGGDADDEFVFAQDMQLSTIKIDGGAGTDVVDLRGNYAAGLTFGAATMVNVETLNLQAGHNYRLTTNNATVAAGKTLTVDASALAATNFLNFNGAAETNGKFVITAGAGNDTLEGGAGNDTLDGGSGLDTASYAHATSGVTVNLGITTAQAAGGGQGSDTLTSIENLTGSSYGDVLTGNSGNNVMNLTGGGNDTANGGGGNDTFNLGAALTAVDKIDGGTGTDTLNLSGNYSAGVVLGATTLINVETVNLAAGHSYKLTTNDATVASGQTLTVTSSALAASNAFVFDGSAEANGKFVIIGGAGNDTLTGGKGADTITGGAGADKLNGGAGADKFVYKVVLDSKSTTYDTITGFDATSDKIDMWFTVTGINTALTTGALNSGANFDANLKTAIGSHLTAHHAIEFTPNSGTLKGQHFLIVDCNGIAGYQAGADLVINLANPVHMTSLGVGTFT